MILRFFISFLMVFSFSNALAKDCKEKAEKLVKKLEKVLVDLEGYAQGDDDPSMGSKLLHSDKNSETYRVEVGHSNEDYESWTHIYEVKIAKAGDWGCYLNNYAFLGSKKSR